MAYGQSIFLFIWIETINKLNRISRQNATRNGSCEATPEEKLLNAWGMPEDKIRKVLKIAKRTYFYGNSNR